MDLTLEQKRAIAIAEARAKAKTQSAKVAPSGGMGVAEDVARSAATGLGEGVTGGVGLLGDVQSLADDFGTWIGNKLGLKPLTPEQQATLNSGARAPTTAVIEQATGFDQIKHTPQTTAGEYARTTGQFVPGFAAGGVKGIVTGIGAGLGSEAAGQATEGTPLETPARIAGSIAGAGGGALMRRAITPRNITPERAAAANTLRKEGIDNLTEGQVTGNPGTLSRERKTNGIFYDQTAERTKQLEKLTQATLAKAGTLARRATPDVVDDAFTRNGQRFDTLASRNPMTIDQQFGQDVGTGLQAYMDLGPPTEKVAALRGFLDRIGSVIDPQGVVSGQAYKSLRSDIERAARGSADPGYAMALRDLKEALDDAMERSMAAAGSPDVGAWRDVRKQYRDLLVVETSIGSTSAEAAEGLITPQALRGAVKTKHGLRNMVRGKGTFEELSRAATTILRELPLTGYAPANAASVWQSGLAAPLEILMRLGRDVRMTKPVQRYLTNRVAPPPPTAYPVRTVPAVLPPFSDYMRERQR